MRAFWRRNQVAKETQKVECTFSSGYNLEGETKTPGEIYSIKDSRATKPQYQGIGQTKYGSAQPPQFMTRTARTTYTGPLSAVRVFPVVYGCITAISDAAAGVGIKVYKVEGGERTEEVHHEFYEIMAKPNPFQNAFEFREAIFQNLDTFGNVFIAKEKVAGRVELYVLTTQHVAIVPDPKKKVAKYVYNVNSSTVDYKPEEIIHIKYADLEDPYYGMPPLITAYDILKFEENRLRFANQFFVNGAIPAGVLETEQTLGDTLLRKLRGEWERIHQGVGSSHKVAILQGGLQYKPVASPLKDLNFDGLKKLSKEDLLTIFKIPESILGNQSGTGVDEGKAALTTFWRSCIVPRLKRVEAALNQGLTETLGDEYAMEFNLKDVVALQEDKVEQAQYLEKMVAASVMSPNEARRALGLPLSDDPYADRLLVSNAFMGNQMVPAEEVVAGERSGSAKQPAPKPGDAGAEPDDSSADGSDA